jgi:RimJ/RimL family protein N-acetyltransferase
MLNLFYYANGLWVAEYALLEAFRNQGYMSELLTELFTNVELFFEIFGITEKFMCLEFVIDNDNIFSRKLVDSVSKSLKLSKTQQGSSIYIDIL